ncbi:MAG: phosphatidate cytidylyltransferase [Candidatus Omnitrophica bacterium]|nr:phosphatidate cytidylyltransferase [Candidatus Omnitrophota bacterium]
MEKSDILPKRIIYNVVLVTVTMLCVFVWPKWAFALWVVFFVGLGLKEFFNLILKKKVPVYKKTGIILGLLIPLAVFFRFKPTEEWVLAFILISFILFFVLQFPRKDNSDAILGISTTVFGVIYVSWLCTYLIKIIYLPRGCFFVLFLLLVSKLGDAGAYVVGKKYGRHKLLKRISPKKSIEGALGGFLVSVLIALMSKLYLPEISLFHLAALGCMVGLAAQLGDLSESLIKRDCGVKDSGRFIPGQGGVLDTLDSILFSAPVVYLYVKVILETPLGG